jgi:hypothetical protein
MDITRWSGTRFGWSVGRQSFDTGLSGFLPVQPGMIVAILLSDTAGGGSLVFEIERGHLGITGVELARYQGTEPIVVESLVWDGIAPARATPRDSRSPFPA